MNSSVSDMYIFGDIEGNKEIYNNTLECIKHNWKTSRFIFLGDIYSSRNMKDSIDIIKSLGSHFWVNEEVITKRSEPIDVLRLFRRLWKDKDLKCINPKYRQFWKYVPKLTNTSNTTLANINPNVRSNAYHKCKFLFGNKEIEFLSDIINSKNITKHVRATNAADNTSTVYFNIPVTFVNNKTKLEETVVNVYTYSQLNVMYNYLKQCEHYYVENGILYTHCYFNCNMIDGINAVVAGHNKGYGKFKDIKYNNIDIYLIDITSNWTGKNNFMMYTDNSIVQFNNESFPDGLYTLRHYT